MNKNPFRYDFLAFGLLVSLSGHFFCMLAVTPVINSPCTAAEKSHTEFLGSILADVDFSFPLASGAGQHRLAAIPPDLAKKDSPAAKTTASSYKPEAQFQKTAFLQEEKVFSRETFPAVSPPKEIVFGFSDYKDYIFQADFSDLEKMVVPEGLASAIDFKILLSAQGEVLDIEKIAGCGDPALDLHVMLKMKRAVFRPLVTGEQMTVKVHFRLR